MEKVLEVPPRDAGKTCLRTDFGQSPAESIVSHVWCRECKANSL